MPNQKCMTETEQAPGTEQTGRQRRARNGQRGSETLAGAFALMIMIVFMVVIVDIGWGVFVKVSLQHAVREGVRFAVTNQVSSDGGGGNLGHLSSIRGVVIYHAGNVISGQEDKITVKFFNPSNLAEDLGANRNRGGNVVMVSVEDYQYHPIIPIGRNDPWWSLDIKHENPIVITVHAADRMEGCPMGICSPL